MPGTSTVTVSAVPRIGTATGGTCPGTYYAKAAFYSPSGTLTWTPASPNCVLKDVTVNRPPGYASKIEATNVLTKVACGDSPLSFTADVTKKYGFTIYVVSPVPANWTGPLLLEVSW